MTIKNRFFITFKDENMELLKEIQEKRGGISPSQLFLFLLVEYDKITTSRPVGRPKKENETPVGYWYNPITKKEEQDFYYIDTGLYETMQRQGKKIRVGDFSTGAVTSEELMYNLTHNPELWKGLDREEKTKLKDRFNFTE